MTNQVMLTRHIHWLAPLTFLGLQSFVGLNREPASSFAMKLRLSIPLSQNLEGQSSQSILM